MKTYLDNYTTNDVWKQYSNPVQDAGTCLTLKMFRCHSLISHSNLCLCKQGKEAINKAIVVNFTFTLMSP